MAQRLVVLADVGGEDFHVGDQAMLDANLALIAEQLPEVDVDVHGRGTSVAGLRDAVVGASAVLVSGGGNLSSTWPHLLDQRLGLLEAAATRCVPVVTGGQTIGPVIDEPRRSRLAAALATVELLGVREVPSARLAVDLGVDPARLAPQVDDAYWVAGAEPEDRDLTHLLSNGYLCVTVDGSYAVEQARPALQSLAAQVAVLATRLAVPVLVIPHVGRLGSRQGEDPDAGRWFVSLAGLAGARAHLADVPTVPQAVWLHQHATLTVSTRYHPLVFGSRAGVPGVGIARDEYTAIKLGGALAHVGAERWVLSSERAEAGGLLTAVTSLMNGWSAGAAERADAQRRIRADEEVRRQRLVDVLRRATAADPPE